MLMIRQLIEAFARELRMLRLANALSKTVSAAYARETALLESVQRRRVTVPADCPLTDCQTCRTDPQPLDVVAEEQRAGETHHAIWWLISAYPDVWYFAKPETVQAVAARLVRLRAAIQAGRIAR
jgi:hypothetical protein